MVPLLVHQCRNQAKVNVADFSNLAFALFLHLNFAYVFSYMKFILSISFSFLFLMQAMVPNMDLCCELQKLNHWLEKTVTWESKRMKKLGYITILIFLGFFMIPEVNYACGKMDQKLKEAISCEGLKESASKDCCTAGHSENSGKSCGENCADPACHCPVNYVANFLLAEIQHSIKIFQVIQTDFFYRNNPYSSAFRSIWLPPKLG